MSFDPLTAAFELGKIAIEKIWPDPTKRAEELLKLEELKQRGALEEMNAHVQLMLGQIEINKEEAKHPNWFIAGWRPGVGWVGVISLFVTFVPKAIVLTIFWVYEAYLTLNPKYIEELVNGVMVKTLVVIPSLPPFPDLGVVDVIGLLVSMLGVGVMRSYDKKNSVDTKGFM